MNFDGISIDQSLLESLVWVKHVVGAKRLTLKFIFGEQGIRFCKLSGAGQRWGTELERIQHFLEGHLCEYIRRLWCPLRGQAEVILGETYRLTFAVYGKEWVPVRRLTYSGGPEGYVWLPRDLNEALLKVVAQVPPDKFIASLEYCNRVYRFEAYRCRSDFPNRSSLPESWNYLLEKVLKKALARVRWEPKAKGEAIHKVTLIADNRQTLEISVEFCKLQWELQGQIQWELQPTSATSLLIALGKVLNQSTLLLEQ